MSLPKPPIPIEDFHVEALTMIRTRLTDVSNVLIQWSQEAMKHQKTLDDYLADLGARKGFDPKEYDLDPAGKRMVPKVAETTAKPPEPAPEPTVPQ